MKTIKDSDKFSKLLRDRAIDIETKSVLITSFKNSVQSEDLTEPCNCDGFGRIRHFKMESSKNWIDNPLPILPANASLGIDDNSHINAQVFQNAICNWRCWYCFVDFKLLNGDKKFSEFKSAEELLDMFFDVPNHPLMIDLTGGQPDLTPEWVPWMMEELIRRGKQDSVYLWSDDNLSNYYFWEHLSSDQIDLIQSYDKYGRVCCFKGIDEDSFSVNTAANPELFDRQFDIASKLLALDIDLYFYITLTASTNTKFDTTIPNLFDRLQKIHPNLPLRIIPLEVLEYSPVKPRVKDVHRDFMEGQYKAIEVWKRELESRYKESERNIPINKIILR